MISFLGTQDDKNDVVPFLRLDEELSSFLRTKVYQLHYVERFLDFKKSIDYNFYQFFKVFENYRYGSFLNDYDFLIAINSEFKNLLSSTFSSFESTKIFLNGKEELSNNFKKNTEFEFDNTTHYPIFYQSRNFTMHQGNLITKVSHIPKDEEKIEVFIDKKLLYEWIKVGKKVGKSNRFFKVIDSYGEYIPVVEEVNKMGNSVYDIYNKTLLLMIDRNVFQSILDLLIFRISIKSYGSNVYFMDLVEIKGENTSNFAVKEIPFELSLNLVERCIADSNMRSKLELYKDDKDPFIIKSKISSVNSKLKFLQENNINL